MGVPYPASPRADNTAFKVFASHGILDTKHETRITAFIFFTSHEPQSTNGPNWVLQPMKAPDTPDTVPARQERE